MGTRGLGLEAGPRRAELGAGYYFDILPGIVSDLDPTRPYTPGSPWSFRDGVHPNDPSHGSMHVWDVWNDKGLALPLPDLEAKVERAAGGYTVTVTATTLQRDVALLADKVAPAAVSDDMLITLLAGETAAFHVRTVPSMFTE